MADDIAINSLAEQFQSFVRQEIANGRFRSAQEVVTAALELLQEREQRLAALRARLEEGERPSQAPPPPLQRPA